MFGSKFLPLISFPKGVFQIKFSGLKPKNGGIYNVREYLRALFAYTSKKAVFSVAFFLSCVGFIISLFKSSKTYIVRKLIWSRGKLGRPVANLAILSVAFAVFLTGGVFSSTDFVNSAEISSDYLANVDDVIPEVTVATTSLPEGRRTEAVVHEVKPGESLSSIGELYKVTTDALKYINNITDANYLKVGQQIIIPPIQGVIYKVKEGETCDSIGKKFEVPSQAILDFNYLDSCLKLPVGKELVVPDAKIPEPPTIIQTPANLVYRPFVDSNPQSGWCQWPTTVRIITQYFAYYHNGLDIATPWGLWPPIYACSSGVVVRAGWDPQGLGLRVVVDHGNGYVTTYGHLSKINVSVGREVEKGDVVGVMGSTGRSTGPHVHFIIALNGVPQNPLRYLR
ncbi:peptidoglycan DD-metalloendopeptidase family protein [candidate division WWE3 bacterium]|nr:peptidoglycan DD-metalloendopeptidase family protein [candidate division WWE3 bacterium]